MQGVYISTSFFLLPVEQLLQLALQQLRSKMVQKYLDMLHPTLEFGHTSKPERIDTPSCICRFPPERYRPEVSRPDQGRIQKFFKGASTVNKSYWTVGVDLQKGMGARGDMPPPARSAEPFYSS